MPCTIGDDVDLAASILARGGLVAIPTETVYGLAANALDAAAVAKIFAAKERPSFDPLIVHVPGADWLPRLAVSIPPAARQLIAEFWPGPLTIVVPKREVVPDLVTSGLATVGLRVPAHPLTLDLLRRCEIPLAAPSANLFGSISPTTAAHVQSSLGDRIDYILDGGPCRVGVESTVIDFSSGAPTLLRPGGLEVEEIERRIGPLALPEVHSGDAARSAPGMLTSHYAPRTPLMIIGHDYSITPGCRMGLLTLRREDEPVEFEAIEVLSESGDLIEAASRLFAAMRRLDDANLDVLIAHPVPEVGLGRAINDRLRRATGEWIGA